MSINQQKEVRQVESFNVGEESPNLPRVNAVSNVTEQELRRSGKNRITALESRTLSPPPQSTFIREQSLAT